MRKKRKLYDVEYVERLKSEFNRLFCECNDIDMDGAVMKHKNRVVYIDDAEREASNPITDWDEETLRKYSLIREEEDAIWMEQ